MNLSKKTSVFLVMALASPMLAFPPVRAEPSSVDFPAGGFSIEKSAIERIEIKAAHPQPLPSGFVQEVRNKWKQKGCPVGFSETEKCRLNECEFGLPHCRADHIMFFRGEQSLRARPAVSGMLRSQMAGSPFAPSAHDSFEVLERLKKDLTSIRPFDGHTDGESLALLRREGHSEWRSFIEDDLNFKSPPMRPYSRAVDTGFLAILANIHFGGGSLLFYENEETKVPFSLDPFVSLTTVADQALAFATPEKKGAPEGLLIVGSLPASEIKSFCKEEVPAAGSFLDLYECEGTDAEYKNENEIDAFLYLNPDWIVDTYRVPGRF